MRPILKSSARRDGLGASEAAGEGVGASRTAVRSLFASASPAARSGAGSGARRVTFSPFALARRRRARKKASAGFSFSSAVQMRRRAEADARRQQELQVMRTLHSASKRRPRSVKETLLRQFPVLNEYFAKAKTWIDFLRETHDALRLRYEAFGGVSRRRRLLPPAREQWTEFDDADHAYVRGLVLPAEANAPAASARVLMLPGPQDSSVPPPLPPQPATAPNLEPAYRGSFSRLLRRGGVAADEDDAREIAAISDDLRGVGRAPLTLRRTRSSR